MPFRFWRNSLIVVYSVLLLLAAQAPLAAQFNLGTITGTVVDPDNSAVAGCMVTVVSLTNHSTRWVVTNIAGQYTVASLPADTYDVTVAAPGFQKVAIRLEVGVDQSITADYQLKIGSAAEEVQVNAVATSVQVEKDDYAIAHIIGGQDLQELPVAGRSFMSVANAGPGTGRAGDIPNGPLVTYSTVNNEMILAGQVVGSTNFLQDGVMNMNLLTGTANIVPSVESIQEVSVETNGMSARFASPGLVNVVSKRGSNAFHGTVYDYLGNDALNARSFFAATNPELRYNQYGGNLGAPIVKNKLFAFFDYAGQKTTTSTVSRTRVPTDAERQGNFGTTTIYDPLTYSAATGAISAFPNNTIPSARISSFATQFLQYFPAANTPLVGGINYALNLPNPATVNHYTGRMDYIASSKDTLSGQVQEVSNPGQNQNINPAFNLFSDRSGANAYLQDIHVFSSGVINVARVGYNRSIEVLGPKIQGQQNFAQLFGLQNLNVPTNQSVPPTAAITGCCSLGYPQYPMGGRQNLYQLADELNWTIGRHQLFFGAEVNRLQFNGIWENYDGGGYTFNGQFTSNHGTGAALKLGPGLADFMLGFPSVAEGAQGIPEGAFRSSNIAGYVQDNWKISPKLTLNLGLRYEFFAPPNDKWGHNTIFNLASNSYSHGTWQPEYRDFSPRLGFAYALTDHTVIRAGAGVYYATEPYQFLQYMVESPQYYTLQLLSIPIASPVPVQNAFSANPSSSALGINTLGAKMPTPYTEQWNFGIQHSFSNQILTTVSYVGNASHHQSMRLNPNQAVQDADPTHPTPLASRRPYPALGDVTAQYNIVNANYNSLQATLQYRFSHGLTAQASYTWSKALDLTDGGATGPVNSLDLKGSYGLANFDRAQTFNATYTYELPFGTGKALLNGLGWVSKEVLGGWNVSGITTKSSGPPFELTATDTANTGSGAHIQVANRLCNGNLSSGRTIQHWFDTSCFVQPAAGVLGNEGRNVLWGPGLTNFDLAAYKRFPLGEGRWVQIRADFFGAFNHPQFAIGPPPNTQSTQAITATTYGQLTYAAGARVISLSLKIFF